MIATRPAVQKINRVRRYVSIGADLMHYHKREANRRHRRYLNERTKAFVKDPELFDHEGFDAPSLSSWDID